MENTITLEMVSRDGRADKQEEQRDQERERETSYYMVMHERCMSTKN